MLVESMPIGFILALPILTILYYMAACLIAGMVVDTVSSYKPDVKLEWLAIESIEVDINLRYKQYAVWASNEALQSRIDLILKDWMKVEV